MSKQAILLTESKSGIGTLTFNRPERKNSLSPDLLMMIHNTLQEWRKSDEVRVVVITGGTGKAFSSGFEIGSIPTEMPTDLSPETIKMIRAHNPFELAMKIV